MSGSYIFQMSSTSPVGTIAYIIDEEALLVRVNKGWQYIAVSVCFCFCFSPWPCDYATLPHITRQPIDHHAAILSTAGHSSTHRDAFAAHNGRTTTAAPTGHAGLKFAN